MAAVGARGRVSDRSVVRTLGWDAGQRLDIRAVQGSVLVRASVEGLFTLTSQGYVRLPAVARQWCGVRAGEKVLLVAEPQQGVLVVHTMPTVETLVAGYHASLLGGDQR